jgi:hypothetical protein
LKTSGLKPVSTVAARDAAVAQSTQGQATAEARAGVPTSVGMLLASHILHDGEVVLLVLKPSVWFVVLSSLWFAGAVLVLLCAALLLDLPGRRYAYAEVAAFLIAGRVMWAVLQWMGRLYILTDMRILRLSGVFAIDIFDCPLRKVARTRIIRSMRERLFRLGTIEIIPSDDDAPFGQWQTVARPVLVHEQIVAAINRCRQGRAAL